jgi:hypothetical protein
VNPQGRAETARDPSQRINGIATSVKAGIINRNMIYDGTNDGDGHEHDGTNHNYDIETNGIGHICNGDGHTHNDERMSSQQRQSGIKEQSPTNYEGNTGNEGT